MFTVVVCCIGKMVRYKQVTDKLKGGGNERNELGLG